MSLLTFFAVVFVIVFAIGLITRTRWLSVIAGAVSLSVVAYAGLGLIISRVTGMGRFYSLPFGGHSLSKRDLFASLLFWLAMFGMGLYKFIPREWSGVNDGNEPGRVVGRAAIALAPLCMIPLSFWLGDYVNLGVGEGGMIILLAWMVWAPVFFVMFMIMTAKQASLKRSIGWSAGIASGAVVVLLVILIAASFITIVGI